MTEVKNCKRGDIAYIPLLTRGCAGGVVLFARRNHLITAWPLQRFKAFPSKVELLDALRSSQTFISDTGVLGFADKSWIKSEDTFGESELPKMPPYRTFLPDEYVEFDSLLRQRYVEPSAVRQDAYFRCNGVEGHDYVRDVLSDMVATGELKPSLRPFALTRLQWEHAVEQKLWIDPRFFCPELGIEAKTPYVLPPFPYDHEGT